MPLTYVGDKGFIGAIRYAAISSSQVYQNNDVVATVPGMTMAVEANALYKVKYELIYAGNGGDLKVNFTVPSGATFKGGINDLATTSTNTFGVHRLDALANIFAANLLFGDVGDGGDLVPVFLEGIVTTTNAGNVVMSAAQSVSDPSATTLVTGTNAMYWRVG